MATDAPPLRYRDTVLHIPTTGAGMLGVLSEPTDAPVQRVGVVVVVGGAQYRVGSHRQFVHLARHLAAAGHPVLRFDTTGMGDSPGAFLPFENTHGDIGAAIQALRAQCPGLDKVVLWGLCDGASAALLYLAHQPDACVAGVVALNPWVRSEVSLAQAQVKHYYRRRFADPQFWRKLLAGGVGRKALADLWGNLRRMRQRTPQSPSAPPFQQRMALGLQNLEGRLLVLLSEEDMTAHEFQTYTQGDATWQALLRQANVAQHTIAGADHTCSTPGSQAEVERLTLAWLARL